MKTTTRLVFGLLASLLFTLGFSRTAALLDPIKNSQSIVQVKSAQVAQDSSGNCISPCAADLS